jgi:putative transposase
MVRAGRSPDELAEKFEPTAQSIRNWLAPAEAVNDRWSMDFVGDSLADGRTFRTLNIVDDCSREAPTIIVDQSIRGERVVRELDELVELRGVPKKPGLSQ